jgi:hypothetical protein
MYPYKNISFMFSFFLPSYSATFGNCYTFNSQLNPNVSSEINLACCHFSFKCSEKVNLKGLSHEMYLAFDDMYGYWLFLQ